ncbi:Mur ligase [Coemansia reversa NRRL 1564]|uniref:Mur ligase n=1 Tax=Coemansia reversa (strain ATCC 12441 / NRRL 1564) TaxID=763665 RepID=A0A2G5BKS0_COERN|nr:Mur ligase [Coemansia reversa NRRL 1564]|eukprot:PIA19600.1 Mur ligase [Coemansia reversa NRRL 1564]
MLKADIVAANLAALPERSTGIVLGLERIVNFLENTLPYDPRTKLRVVHVAGTNGKGSVCALISEALIAAGYKVGTFNSPHFLEPNDALRIQGMPIPESEHAELREWIRTLDAESQSPSGQLTSFEQVTASALWWFAQNDVDIAVVEVGMGGLRDATNVFASPDDRGSMGVGRSLVQCICPVDEDHLGVIGNNVEEIAREKAGIMRPGSWIIIANQDRTEAFHKIRQTAHRVSPGRIVNVRRQPTCDIHVPNFSIKSCEDGDNVVQRLRPPTDLPCWASFNGTGKRCLRAKYPASLDTYIKSGHAQRSRDPPQTQVLSSDVKPLTTESASVPIEVDLPLALPGYYQAGNACVAFYALDVLRTQFGFTKLTDAAMQVGFQNVRWPGRLSWLSLLSKRAALPRSATPSFPEDMIDSAASVNSGVGMAYDHSGNNSSGNESQGGSGHRSSGSESGSIDPTESLDNWLLADGAHNEPAAVELRKYVDTTLRRISQQRYIRGTRTRNTNTALHVRWIVGFSKGKDVSTILSKLVMPGDTLWIVPFSQPKEMPWIKCESPASIARVARRIPSIDNSVHLEEFDHLSDVVDRLATDTSDMQLNALCGSLYLVADMYRELQIQPF